MGLAMTSVCVFVCVNTNRSCASAATHTSRCKIESCVNLILSNFHAMFHRNIRQKGPKKQ